MFIFIGTQGSGKHIHVYEPCSNFIHKLCLAQYKMDTDPLPHPLVHILESATKKIKKKRKSFKHGLSQEMQENNFLHQVYNINNYKEFRKFKELEIFQGEHSQ